MSRENGNEWVTLTVTGTRTIPTKPYGNEKWEFLITRTGEDLLEVANLEDMRIILSEMLDAAEQSAIAHAHPNESPDY